MARSVFTVSACEGGTDRDVVSHARALRQGYTGIWGMISDLSNSPRLSSEPVIVKMLGGVYHSSDDSLRTGREVIFTALGDVTIDDLRMRMQPGSPAAAFKFADSPTGRFDLHKCCVDMEGRRGRVSVVSRVPLAEIDCASGSVTWKQAR